MKQETARKFWETVLLHSDVLRAPLHREPATPAWEEAVEKATDIVPALDDAAREVDGRLSVEIEQVSTERGGTILMAVSYLACFVPTFAVTDMDHGIPGSLASQLVLGMGIGELKLMTRIAKIGVVVTDMPPATAVTAWELNDLLDRAALVH